MSWCCSPVPLPPPPDAAAPRCGLPGSLCREPSCAPSPSCRQASSGPWPPCAPLGPSLGRPGWLRGRCDVVAAAAARPSSAAWCFPPPSRVRPAGALLRRRVFPSRTFSSSVLGPRVDILLRLRRRTRSLTLPEAVLAFTPVSGQCGSVVRLSLAVPRDVSSE